MGEQCDGQQAAKCVDHGAANEAVSVGRALDDGSGVLRELASLELR